MRYENWLRWRIADGTPPAVADANRDAGRKLLGRLMQQLELSGNLQGEMHQTTPDGTEIVAKFDGTTPIVEIAAPGTGKSEPVCKGLIGHISKPQVVQDWPVAAPISTTYGVGDLDNIFFTGSQANTVYMLYRSPHSPGWGEPYEPRSFYFDPAVPALRTYAKGVSYSRKLVNPPIMYRDPNLGDGPLMTSAPWLGPEKVNDEWVFTFPIQNIRTGTIFEWTLSSPDFDPNQWFQSRHAPIMINWDGAGSGQSNVVPVFVDTYDDLPHSAQLTDQGIVLFDYRKRLLHGPVSIFDPALPSGASAVGMKDGKLYALGYGDAAGPTDDEYIVNFDTHARTHRHLNMKCQFYACAQVCDTLLLVGTWTSKTKRTGDVWLYKLGGVIRKIGHIPELDATHPFTDDQARMTNSIYVVPTSRCVYLFTPVMDAPDNVARITKYRVRTIT